jgi:methionine aminopeptidase
MTVTDNIQIVAEEYNCKPIAGMLSYQLQQHRIDGEKSIIQNPDELQRKDLTKVDFAQHEVYGVDILISTGDGKVRMDYLWYDKGPFKYHTVIP